MDNLWKDPVFKTGDKITCKDASSYYSLTEKKKYEVVEYIPVQYIENLGGFRFPAYVVVLDNNNKRIIAHASRFKLDQE